MKRPALISEYVANYFEHHGRSLNVLLRTHADPRFAESGGLLAAAWAGNYVAADHVVNRVNDFICFDKTRGERSVSRQSRFCIRSDLASL